MASRNPDLNENPQGPVVPASISNKGGIAPQATSTIGTPAPPPQNITATGNSSATTVLNPFGPRNDLLQGGIVMDLPAICYSQFIQIPNQLEVTDDTVPWTIIAQLPYDPTSEYMNSYCRAYALQHQRYNGDIMYQVEVIGNATFSGTLAIGWVPQRIKESIANPEVLQKYAYKTMSITLPSVEQFVLKDARQVEYYRTHDTDVDNRPHLVIAVHTSVVSPLRTGITVRIRLASRFASVTDAALYGAQPFFLSDPVPVALGPTPSSSIFDGRAMEEVFPHMKQRGYDFRMMTDGIATVSHIVDIDKPNVPWSFFTKTPGLIPSKNVTLQGYVVRISDPNMYFVVYSNSDDADLQLAFAGIDFSKMTLAGLQQNPDISIPNRKVVRASFVSLQSGNITIKAQYDIITSTARISAWIYESTQYSDCMELPYDITASAYKYPFSNVLGPVVHSEVTGLPLNWRNIVITSEPVTTVQAVDVAPSAFSDPVFESVVAGEAAKVSSDSILQFDLEDPESRQRVATLRWSKERSSLVIATTDLVRYALYPSSVNKLIIGNWAAVPKASGFPNTPLSQWASRTAATVAHAIRTPNAALAGEVVEALEAVEGGVAEEGSLSVSDF